MSRCLNLTKLSSLLYTPIRSDEHGSLPLPPPPSSADAVDIFIEGDNHYAKTPFKTISNANSGKNVICVSLLTSPSGKKLLFSGGVDTFLRCYDLSTDMEIFAQQTSAPVLVCQSSSTLERSRVACGMMDGSLTVVSAGASPSPAPILSP